jgi:putative transcriptional regulator
MTKKARDEIAVGLQEAIAVARGDAKPARLHVRQELDVKAIRMKTGLSQKTFAYSFGFTMEQIRSWEQGRARPLGGVRAYLLMIDTAHEAVAKILEASRKRTAT